VAEDLAAAAADRGFAARLVAADRYRPRDLAKERLLIAVICTQGEGEPPESARELFNYLRGKTPPELGQLQYAIFGLGDSSYEYFCQAAKDLEQLLKSRGARSLLERVDADVDFQTHTAPWSGQVLDKVEQTLRAAQAQIIPLQRAQSDARYDRNRPYQAQLLERRRLTTDDALSEVYHLSLAIDASAISYQPGDALGVYFRNDPALVEQVLALTGHSAEAGVSLHGESLTLAQALGERLELTQLHPAVVTAWAQVVGDHKGLSVLSGKPEAIRRFAAERQLIDLLEAYPATLDAQGLVELLQPLQPRLYSIASSQAVSEDEIHLTVSTLSYQAHGREHLGGASGYLTRRLAEGERLGIYLAENGSFRLPSSAQTPIVMIGAGTGIAPFRAFLQEREAQGAAGRNWLVFGNRHFHRDFLYQKEWIDYRKAGLLQRISLAFSRDGDERTYVQSRLHEEGAELYRWLREGAHLYVCGGIEMEQAVRQSLQEIIQVQGGLDEEGAIAYVEALRDQGRYQKDVY
jgi:sulfite reductase (NADPH) flavoprotein alpha-component